MRIVYLGVLAALVACEQAPSRVAKNNLQELQFKHDSLVDFLNKTRDVVQEERRFVCLELLSVFVHGESLTLRVEKLDPVFSPRRKELEVQMDKIVHGLRLGCADNLPGLNTLDSIALERALRWKKKFTPPNPVPRKEVRVFLFKISLLLLFNFSLSLRSSRF